MKIARIIVAIFLSGLCWYFSCDLSGNYWYLLWFAPMPVLLISFYVGGSAAFIMAFAAYLIGRLSWLPYLLKVLPVPPAILFTILLPLMFALLVLLTRKIVLSKQNTWSAFAFPVLCCLFEFLFFKFSPDGTAGSLAYSQANFLPVVQIASVTGILGITFLVTLFPSAIAVAIYHRSNKNNKTPLYIIFSLVIISILFGIIRMNGKSSFQNSITAGLVVIDEKFHAETNNPEPDNEVQTANLYANAVAGLAQQGAQVVVLPEKAVNVTIATDSVIKRIFTNAATDNHVALVIGYTEFIRDSLKLNKALVISDQGSLLADYQKVKLFEGEARNRFMPGKEIATFNLHDISSGVAICKDLDYQNIMRKYGEKNIQILYVPAWDFIEDGWLHSRMAIFRGVENGYSVARTARQGVLTISDYRGKVSSEVSSANNKAASLLARIPLHITKTIYKRFGDWFGFTMIVLACYFIFILVKNINSRRRVAKQSSV
ncbi:MAG TPA: nitrilase-related carbon-nitrogen hydrolase [Chitinophagaceae bacterium]|nr:nitrilase-related carbon-nitrogen hydrolase [Chitinophagaceae bacterium]